VIRRPLWPVFLHSSVEAPFRHLEGSLAWGPALLFGASDTQRGPPWLGVLLCRLAHQSLKEAPWVGSSSIVQCLRHLRGQPHYCSAASAGVWGDRGYGDGSPPPTHDSAVSPCFHGCLAFPPEHFPPQSPPSHPLDPSLCSQQQPSPWDYSTTPKLQLPDTAPSKGSTFLSRVCMAAARTDSHSF